MPLSDISEVEMAAADQKPVNSGFTAKSTAAEVIHGIDLSGKSVIVTGGYSGIGVETVAALAAAGAEIMVPARDVAKAKAALADVKGKIEIAAMDLGDLASVEKFARDFASGRKALHLLINNAGVMACPETRIGKDWELQFATNHIGHFALTAALLPLLRAATGARVVALSSTGHKISGIRWDDIHFRKGGYDKWVAYGQSKTANALFAVGLDRREKSNGVRAFSVHPGGIVTPLQRHLAKEEMIALGWLGPDGEVSEMAKAMFKTPEQGASTTVFAATSALLDGKGGVYCENGDIAVLAGPDAPRWAEVQPYACDDAEAERLWAETERMIA
ncbi:MAG: oxidoreductase [Parvularculaceae bacterium]|nr:oxidoreductase [Parvularculaceae bacterium]